MTEERKQAIESLDRIHNYCEEIDNHIPKEERTGYKMLPDVLLISDFLRLTVSNLAERDIPKARFQCRCGVCDLDLNEVEFGTVEIETNEQLRTHYRYCPRCGQRIDWEHDDLYDKREENELCSTD